MARFLLNRLPVIGFDTHHDPQQLVSQTNPPFGGERTSRAIRVPVPCGLFFVSKRITGIALIA